LCLCAVVCVCVSRVCAYFSVAKISFANMVRWQTGSSAYATRAIERLDLLDSRSASQGSARAAYFQLPGDCECWLADRLVDRGARSSVSRVGLVAVRQAVT